MTIVTASSKYQIAIPKSIRNRLNIKPGQKILMTNNENSITLTPIPNNPIEYLCGILKDEPSMTAELLEERKRDLELE
jgi:AbrB family looped-hinge helix DNA binding protein